MFIYLYVKEHRWDISSLVSNIISVWINEFKHSSTFRRTLLLVFYTSMILFITLLNREIWFDPLGKIMEGWTLYDVNGNLTIESIENFMLFIPFTILLLWAFKNLLFKDITLNKVFLISFKVIGIFSLTIEFLQVLLHVGTFQLSDLVYNTLGGIIGGLLYFILYKIKYSKFF